MKTDELCRYCKHFVVTDTRSNWNGAEPTKKYSCDLTECPYEDFDEESYIKWEEEEYAGTNE